ncbi:MAG TPA: ceramidase domain-containing protein [Pseudonocardiaceae bacterium]
MDWNAHVDSYCERTGPEFWSEPVNAATNLAFLLAAFLLWFLARRNRPGGTPVPTSVTALITILVLIGLGSFAFHTVARAWSALLDVVPIALFTHFYVVCYLHWFWGVRWSRAWWGFPAFLVFSLLVSTAVGPLIGRGSGSYLPALVGMLVLGGALALSRDASRARYGRMLVLAGGVFAVSLLLRAVDAAVCSGFATGTHFLWHVLNACVLYLVTRAVIVRWQESVLREHPGSTPEAAPPGG